MSTLAQDVIAMEEQLGIAMACRAIHAGDKRIVAFDMLLDNGDDDGASALSEFLAGSDIISTYADVYQERRIEHVPLFVRVKPGVLLELQAHPQPVRQYVLEVPATRPVPPALADKLRALRDNGYQLALADYMPGDPDIDALVDLVDVVRLDLNRVGVTEICDMVMRLHGTATRVLADGIDTAAQFDAARNLGVDYFQGRFITATMPIPGKKMPSNKLLLLELLVELQNPNTSPAALERIAIRDAGLTWRILKGINAAAMGLNREITSLSQAIALMGTNELKRWTHLLLADGDDGKPGELMRRMLVRGRMCELMAELSGQDDPISHFIVGLLSRLDAMMDIDMEELMRQVPLSHETKEALLHRTGTKGRILDEVERYEDGRFTELTWIVEPQFYEVAYRHSVEWARQTQQAMAA